MNIIRRSLVWLRRIGYCKGFHVQSPTDYWFICHVINEQFPYYAYSDLQNKRAVNDIIELKLCRLLFRISNFVQSSVCVDFSSLSSNSALYIKAGSKKTRIVSFSDVISNNNEHYSIADIESLDMVHIALPNDQFTYIYELMDKVNDSSVFIIEGIYYNKETRCAWSELLNDERVRISYDLYYCGILFFDSNRYKQNYKVNF